MKTFKTLLTLFTFFLISNYSFTQITSYPHHSDFEVGFGDWNQSGTDDFNWTRTSTKTPSSGTGPQTNPYGALGSQSYVFTETSSPRTNNQIARIYCTYDLSGATSATINFNHYSYAATHSTGTLRLKVYYGNSSSGGASSYPWVNTTSFLGWKNVVFDLTPYCGYSFVQLAFESITPSTGTCWQSDNSIDEVIVDAVTCVNVWNGAAQDGDWNNVANWTCNTVPSTSSDVNISSGNASYPSLISSATVNNLTISAGAELNIADPNVTLTVTGDFSSSGIVNIQAGKLDITGNGSFSRGATIGADGEIEVDGATGLGSGYDLIINDGVFDANGNFDATVDPPTFPNADIDISGNGRLTLAGGTNFLGDLSTSGGTVEYDGSSQTIVSDYYPSLEIDGSGTKTAGGGITTIGSVTITLGVMSMGSYDLTIGDDFNCTQYGFDEGTGKVTFNLSNSHEITHNGSTETTSTVTDQFDESWDNGSASNTWSVNHVSGDGWYLDASGFAYYYYDASAQAFSIYWTSAQSFTAGDELDFSWKDATGGYTEKYALVISTSTNYWGTTTIYDEDGFSNTAWTSRSASYTIPSTNTYYIGFLCYSDANMFWVGVDDFDINKTSSVTQDCAGKLNDFTLNGSGDLTLNSPLTIDGNLTLTNGDIISSSSNYVKITKNGSISGGSNDSHIVGELKQETESTSAITLPVGDGTNLRPVVLTPSSTDNEIWTVKYYNTAHANTTMGSGLHHVSQYYWDISRTNSVNAVLAFDWDQGYAVDAPIDLKLAHYNSGNNEWEDMSAVITGSGGNGSASASSGRLTANATSFSPFGFGSGSSGNALPIDLISFDGEIVGDDVKFDWVVASQINNDYFTVEKTYDFNEWSEVSRILGVGNTNIEMSYTTYDENPKEGVTYYRLSQTDYDGITKTFHPISITIKGERKEIVKRTNLLGQSIESSYHGIVITIWDNGDITKTMKE